MAWIAGAVVALALAFPSLAAADPACDPALALDDVHSGGAVHGTLTCDDPSGSGLNYAIAPGGDPAHGFAQLDGAGGVDYFADSTYAGPDGFTVEVDDNVGGGTTVDVSVQVVNAAPSCQDVTLDPTPPGQSAFGSADCADADGDALDYAVDSPPDHGTATVDFGSIQYTPDDGFAGTDTFTYTASDGIETSAPATVTVQVVNHAPTCDDETLELRAGKPATGFVSCFDEDFQPLTASVVDAPAHGSVAFGDDGFGSPTYTYTPAAGYTGSDHFTYKANDGTTDSAPARVDITVTHNHAPDCSVFPIHTHPGDAVQVSLFCTDQDTQDSDALTYSLSAPSPAHGTITDFQQSSGFATLTYTPANGYVGADSFGFTASDGDLSDSATQVVHVSDHPFCDPLPDAQVRPGRSFSGFLQCTEPPDTFDSLTFTLTSAPSKGTTTLNFGGFTYTSNAGASGPDSFAITAHSASAGDSSPVTQQVTITPDANSAPQCEDFGGPQVVYSGRSTPLFPFCFDNDFDPLVYATNGSPAHGTSSAQGGGISYTANAGYTGPDSVPFTVTDGRVVVPGTIDVDVHAPEAPTCQAVPSFAVRPGRAHAFFLDCTDPQGDDEAFHVVQQGTKGTVAFDEADFGGGTYTANQGASGSDSFQVRASNPVGPSNTVTVQVTNIAESVNEDPVCTANSFFPRTVATGVATSLPLGDVCSDPDGDPLTFTRASQPSHGSLTAGPASSLSYTSTSGYLGPDSFTYTASDDHGGTSVVTTFFVNVAQSAAPTCMPLADVTLRPGATKVVALNCSDPNDATISYQIVSAPGKGTLTPSGTSTDPTREYTANSNATGDDSFTYRATSAGGTSSTYTQAFHISTAANDPPQCFSNAGFPRQVPGGRATTLFGLCFDQDDDPLTYAVVSQPAHGSVALSGGTPVYTPDAGYTGPDSFTFTASDGRVTTPTTTEYLQVVAPVPPSCPTFGAVDVRTNSSGRVIRTACDGGDFDTVTYVLDSGPAHGTLTQPDGNEFGTWAYTPANGFSGDDSFKWHAEDADGSSPQQTQVIHVTPDANADPICVSPISITARPGVARPLTSPCVDDDGDTLTATLATPPAHGTVVLPTATTAGSYTADDGYTGPDSFTVTVSDGHGGTATVTVDVTVSAANSPPSCADAAITVAAGDTYVFSGPPPCTDPDGDPVTLVVVTPPAHGTLGTSEDGFPTYTPDTGYSGPDAFTYKGNDGTADSTVRTVNITVTAPTGPTCSNLTKSVRNDQTLDVTLSCSPNGGGPITGYEIVSPPPASEGSLGTINQTTGVVRFTPHAGFTGPTSFTYRAVRGTETSAPATVSITVTKPPNQAPTASITGPDTAVRATPVSFGSTASDPDGTIAARAWDVDGDGFDDGTGTTISPSFLTGTTATVRLRVTDNDGGQFVATKTITLTNHAPTAAIGGPAQAFRGQPVALTDGSNDPDGHIVSRQWTVAGADAGTGAAISPSFTTLGPKTVTLEVTDNDGASDTATKTVTIVNRPPTAGITGPATGTTGTPVALTGTASDADGAVVARDWDLDDDGAFDDATGATASPSFAAAGTHRVRFRVTDDDGATAIASKTLTISAPSGGGGGSGGGGTGGGGGGTGGGGGGTTDTTPPHGTLAVSAQKLLKALKKGLKVNVTADEACQVTIVATVDKKTAKKLKLGKKAVTVGTATVADPGGTIAAKVKFTRKARKALAKARKVKLKLAATGTDAAGNAGAWTKTVTLKR